MARHLAFLVPATLVGAADGRNYARPMARSLRDAGDVADFLEIAGEHPVADEAARASARSAWDALPADAQPVIDGHGLAAFVDLGDALANRAVALVHCSAASWPGLSEASRAALGALERAILPRLPRVIATSQACGERLRSDLCIAADRLAVVVPGADDAPRTIGSGGPRCAILSVGGPIPRASHDVLLGALARLRDLDWSLTIAGSATREPACAQSLRALADELGIGERVRLVAEPDATALEQLWRGADLFAFATPDEGYPAAVAEALKRGLPVALAADPRVTAMVPQEAGVICPVGDYEGLSKAMRRLIFDADLRQYMAAQAWEAGRRLPDWPTQARAFTAALG